MIAKLDRLSRDAHFLLGLEGAGVDFVAADMPHANRLTVGIMAMVADEERRMISKRTKDALDRKRAWYAGLTEAEKQELRAKGKATQLGGDRSNLPAVNAQGRTVSLVMRQAKAARRAVDLEPIITDLKAAGATSLGQIAAGLNARGIKTARGGAWTAVQVGRIFER